MPGMAVCGGARCPSEQSPQRAVYAGRRRSAIRTASSSWSSTRNGLVWRQSPGLSRAGEAERAGEGGAGSGPAATASPGGAAAAAPWVGSAAATGDGLPMGSPSAGTGRGAAQNGVRSTEQSQSAGEQRHRENDW